MSKIENTSKYYIYVYLDPRKPGQYKYGSYIFNYEPFYVGKGKNRRSQNVSGRTRYFKNKIKKIEEIGLEPIILRVKENLNEIESFKLEKKLIELIGRQNIKNGPLINLTDGGEGISGYTHKETLKKKFRMNFSDIKNEFEKRGYQLLTKEEEYVSNKQKLNYICPNGHKYSNRLSVFVKHNCSYCSGRRIVFSDIKNEFEKRGYQLLTKEEEYKNNKQKLNCICPNGHKYSVTLSNFKQGGECIYCYKKSKKKNFLYIKNEFEKRGYQLLTKEEEYKNNQQKLNYICPKGHMGRITWTSFFNQKSDCLTCSYELRSKKKRKNFNEIRNEFKKKGYQLLTKEEEYKSAGQKLEYICSNGHKHAIKWYYFKKGYKCPYCNQESKRKKCKELFLEIKNEFKKRGYQLLTKEEEYKNTHQKLIYICPNSHKHAIRWYYFKKGYKCPYCKRI